MKIFGIVAEFNPFHNGHKYLIDAVRSQFGPCGIVCVQSGNFVQRGYPAVSDKWRRAEAAVKCGADLVIELPTAYSIGSAKEFAYGAFKCLEELGVITDIAFGSENPDVYSSLSEYSENQTEIRALLNKGLSYPAAAAQAADLDLGPNDILGFEYFKANKSFEMHPIRRAGEGYAESSSKLRALIKDNADISEYVPVETEMLWNASADKRLFDLIKYSVITCSASDFADISDVSEGLENVFKREINSASDFNEFILAVKSKRYTYARLSRILMQLLLGITKDRYAAIKSEPGYCRILAFGRQGAEIIKSAKASGAKLITNLSKRDLDHSDSKICLETDVKASEIYALLTNCNVSEYSDFVKSPVRVYNE